MTRITQDDFKTYQASDGISPHGLMRKTPAHLYHGKGRDPGKEKKHFVIGRAVNDVLLLPEEACFKWGYYEQKELPGGIDSNMRLPANRAWLKKQQKKTGATLLSEKDWDTVQSSVDGVLRFLHDYDLLWLLNDQGVAEHSFYTTDPSTGLKVRLRPDYVARRPFIVDIKSAFSADPDDFSKASARLEYYLQPAFYIDFVSLITGNNYTDCFFIVAEKVSPYIPQVYRISYRMLEYGRRIYKMRMKVIAQCRASGVWLGYEMLGGGGPILDLDLPQYTYGTESEYW